MRERLEERFRALDEVRAPERWPDLETFEPSGRPARRPGPAEHWRKPIAALAALALATSAIGFAVWVFDRTSPPEPAARPTNGKLAFTAYGQPPQPNRGAAYAVDPDGTGLVRVSGSSGTPAYDVREVAWSPDGRQLVVERAGDERTVRLLDPTTGTEVVLQTLEQGVWGRGPAGLAWSPDGDHLAYSAGSTEEWPGPDGTSIHVSPIDGGPSREITAGPADVGAAWSPDGERIVFARWGHARYLGFDCDEPPDEIDYGLHVVARDGGDEIRLTDDGCDAGPDWSPDGSRIAFIRRDTTIATVPAAGGQVGDLFEYIADPGCGDRGDERHRGTEPPAVHDLSWSPDGRWLAFVADDCLYTMRSDGTDVRLVVGPESGLFVASVDWGTAPVTEEPALTAPTPQPSPTGSDEPVGPFRPATYREGDRTVMPVTFPDGTTAELVYPPNLEVLGPGGLAPYSSGYMPGNARDFWIFHGSVENVVHRFEDPELLGEYPDGRGGIVTFWHFPVEPETNWLAFQFGDWTVLVYDYAPGSAGPPMTEEERRVWARTLLGHQTRDGFLLLEALPPLELATAGDHAGPELGLSAHAATGIGVYAERCQSYDKQEGFEENQLIRVGGLVVDRSKGFAAWCDPDTRINVHVTGNREFIDKAIEGLDIRNARYAS
jgi:Tol biopolymer transport system component